MTLVSLQSLIFLVILLCIYYAVPQKAQWTVLLGGSIIYYILSAPVYTICYLIVSVITIYCAARWIENRGKGYKVIYWVTVIINVGILVVLKYLNFIVGNVEGILGLVGVGTEIPMVQLVASLGVSFYTLQMIGYLTDVYWGISKCQNNIGKLALFNSYFPQMISGPISRYGQLENALFSGHAFQSSEIAKGFFRILLGVFKKLILAEQLLQPTEAILSAEGEYQGIFLWVGMGLYVIRIYADFSGCMDIVLGASECFGISLPENFNRPFGSKSIQEFWQRWHITLGTWLKDYIMYPLLRTKAFNKFTRFLKKNVGKQAAKKIPTYLAMLVLWLCMGIWHGGGWNFIAEGLWFWFVIVVGQIFQKQLSKVNQMLHINTQGRIWSCWQKIRTAIIFSVGILFFRSASVGNALTILKNALNIKKIVLSFKQIPMVLYNLDGVMGTVKLVWTAGSILFGIAGLFIFSRIEKKWDSVAEFWSRQKVWVKYVVVYILMFAIIVLGAYGPGYSSSEFIYGGF